MGQSARRPEAEHLIGRDPELDRLAAFLRRGAARSEVLLLSGVAGVGKTALLNATADIAADRGWLVLAGGGTELETDLPLALLHQLLRPVLAVHTPTVGPEHGSLLVAMGLCDGREPPPRQVAAGVLGVLRRVSETAPVLLIVDDLQWVDDSSRAVLGVVADELAGLRAGLLGASRADDLPVHGTAESFPGGSFDRGDGPRLLVPPLTAEASARLLDALPLVMAPGVRRRLLAEAAGIPLALVDLPAALTDAQLTDPRRPPAVLPLTDRLRAPFAAAVRELPEPTAELLLLMAVGSSAQDLAGPAERTAAGDIEPAVRAGLVWIDPRTGRVAFRHPLVRASVLEQSAEADRRRVHGLLAQMLSDQPDRWVWHLAESTPAADERIAALLDRAATRAQRSGDAARAVDLLERSAELSQAPAERGRRLARAAYLAGRVMGELARARALLAEAGHAGQRPGSGVELAIGSAFVELNVNGDVAAAHGLLVGALEAHTGSAGDPVFIEALHNLLEVCLSGTGIDRFAAFRNQLSRVPARAAPELILRAQLLADPLLAPEGTPGALDRSISEIHDESDSTRIIRIAALAQSVDRLGDCREPLWRLVRDGRAGGAVGSAIDALAMLALDGFHAGRWDEAAQLANEGVALSQSSGYLHASWGLRNTIAMVAAARGDDTVLAAQTEAMDLWAGPRGVGSILAYARRARALGALGKGDFQQAYRLLATFGAPGMFDGNAGDAAPAMFDLVEAAMRTDRETDALELVSAIRRSGIADRSPRAAMLAAAAAAIASAGPAFSDVFDEALTVPEIDRWPFELARVRLAYGARLRRAHGVVQARTQLAAALDVFTDLAARPWAARAETELFATGLTRAPAGGVGPGSLTHQERTVAELAAAGLTNKQIAHRLFVSPRTVGAHLRQIFPKLGITSRAAIGDAMQASGDQ